MEDRGWKAKLPPDNGLLQGLLGFNGSRTRPTREGGIGLSTLALGTEGANAQ
jgi:hypothetical protein